MTPLEALLAKPAWMKLGACRGVDPDLMFPATTDSARAAKAVCSGCGVREECLAFAIANHEAYGVWGMTTEKERRRLRREWRQQQPPADACPNGHPNEHRSPVTGKCRTCHVIQNRRSKTAA